MSKGLWKVCVGLVLGVDQKFKYVTDMNTYTKMAYWESGEDALELPLIAAKDLVSCLRGYGYNAFVLQVPFYVELKNDIEAKGGRYNE